MLRLVLGPYVAALLLLVSAQLVSAAPIALTFRPCDGLICLPVTLADGKKHWLLLDTGNVNSWLLADTARVLHLKLELIEQNGKQLEGIFRLGTQTVSLQRQALSARFLAFNREQAGEHPAGVEGALAYTLFSGHLLQIDYPHRTLSVLDAPAGGSAASGAPLQLITFGRQGPPVVVGSGFTVNGKPISAQIDTCYTGTLLVYDQAIADLGLHDAAAGGRPRYFPHTDGGVNMTEAVIDSIAFGGHVLAARPATVYFAAAGKTPVHQPDGLFAATVGNALFAHSIVVLDLQAMRIDVRPG
jgi:hypothetical protein